jgi:hypothetical protein
MANEGNLRRGNVPGADTSAATAARAALRESEEAMRGPDVSPDDVVLAMFQEASIAHTKMLRKWNRSGGKPDKILLEAMRETRQLARDARDIVVARGRTAEAETFFAQVAGRVTSANLGEGPRPVGQVSV